MSLREGGIYCLPNGRELFVLRKHENGSWRIKLRGAERSKMSEYEVTESGRLLCDGKLTAGDVGSLRDTGRTAPPFPHSVENEDTEKKVLSA
jgi:hypothetical protein